MPATNTSSISTSDLRRRHRKASAIRPPARAAATSAHAARSVGVGGAVPVAGAMNSMSIRGPETDAEGLPFPSVNSSAKTKLATLVSAADPKVIPRTRASPGAREGIVQLYRRPWLDRGMEPLSERKAGPLGKVVLSQPMPAACPALRTVKVRTNRDVVLSWTAEAVMARVKEGARRSTECVGVDGTSRFPFLSVAVHWLWIVIERPSAMPRRTTRCAVRECGPGARFDQETWNPSDTFVTGMFSSRYANRKFPPRVQLDQA